MSVILQTCNLQTLELKPLMGSLKTATPQLTPGSIAQKMKPDLSIIVMNHLHVF